MMTIVCLTLLGPGMEVLGLIFSGDVLHCKFMSSEEIIDIHAAYAWTPYSKFIVQLIVPDGEEFSMIRLRLLPWAGLFYEFFS